MKHLLPLLLASFTCALVADSDLALQPAHIIVAPWKQHIPATKRQGVAGIERTAKGRLWAVYGRDVESTRNFQVLKCSDDDGKKWSDVKLMILPRSGTRAMSAAIWSDPLGRLWVFWGQSAGQADGRFGVWAIRTDEPDAAEPTWSAPRRIGDGIMLNKPTVLANGDWPLTSSVWTADNSIKVYASTDKGETFTLRGTANVEPAASRGPDEPMIVERKDGRLWMMVRCHVALCGRTGMAGIRGALGRIAHGGPADRVPARARLPCAAAGERDGDERRGDGDRPGILPQQRPVHRGADRDPEAGFAGHSRGPGGTGAMASVG